MPAVSVIIPVHNRKTLIRGAIDSVLGQTFSDLELIVVDDGSTDGTTEVIGSIDDPRIRVLKQETNVGIPCARNVGVEAARGDFIAWLDSDDLARPHRLEHQLRFLRERPDIALVGSVVGKLDGAGKPLRGQRIPPLSTETVRAWLLFKSAFHQSSVMGRSEVLKACPFREKHPVCSDVDVFVRLQKTHRMTNLARILVDRRTHPGQIVRTRGHAIRENKTTICADALRHFGVAFTPDDLARHVVLGEPKRRSDTVDADFLDWAGDWLQKLIAVNGERGRIDAAALRFACGFFWMRACEAAIPGLGPAKAMGRFAGSPLAVAALSGRSRKWLAIKAPKLFARPA